MALMDTKVIMPCPICSKEHAIQHEVLKKSDKHYYLCNDNGHKPFYYEKKDIADVIDYIEKKTEEYKNV